MTILENIKAVLSEQVNGYRSLMELLQRERECLMQFNAAGVEGLSKEKDTVVLKLRLLEEERVRLVGAYAATNNVTGELSLQRLTELTNDKTFQDIRLRLLSLLQSIVELNEFNRVLIERSTSVVKSALTFLGSFGLELPLRATGTLISREA